MALAALLLVGCGEVGGPTEAVDGDVSPAPGRFKIVNGTRDPRAVPLAEGQQLALGWLHTPGFPAGSFCTATLIAPRVVATASHCTEGTPARDIGFGVGLFQHDPAATFAVVEKHEALGEDAALLVLDRDATDAVPGIVPVPANRAPAGDAWIGRQVQAGGYGQTRDPNRTGRWFATVEVTDVTANQFVVSGGGRQGICFGDSGGPIFGQAGDASISLLGVVHGGDESCVGTDYLTRLDILADWISDVTGVLPGPQPDPNRPMRCGEMDPRGACAGSVALWCQPGDEEPRRLDCDETGQACGWVDDTIGFFCAGPKDHPGYEDGVPPEAM